MFRNMRRTNQELSREQTVEILEKCNNGTLACLGDDSYPYAVPMSYVYSNDRIYFHSAKTGHKIDAMLKEPRVSFAVIEEDQIISEEYTTYFRSVIAFGKARIVEGEEWQEAIMAIINKYSGDRPSSEKLQKITEAVPFHIIAIDIEHLTGKESIELTTQGLES